MAKQHFYFRKGSHLRAVDIRLQSQILPFLFSLKTLGIVRQF
jgi:hypothetical protein